MCSLCVSVGRRAVLQPCLSQQERESLEEERVRVEALKTSCGEKEKLICSQPESQREQLMRQLQQVRCCLERLFTDDHICLAAVQAKHKPATDPVCFGTRVTTVCEVVTHNKVGIVPSECDATRLLSPVTGLVRHGDSLFTYTMTCQSF